MKADISLMLHISKKQKKKQSQVAGNVEWADVLTDIPKITAILNKSPSPARKYRPCDKVLLNIMGSSRTPVRSSWS